MHQQQMNGEIVSSGSPDTTVPSPTQAIATAAAVAALRVSKHFQSPDLSPCNVGELAELNTTEISLDLQGLIDDTNFGDENLFGDLVSCIL